MAAGYRIFGFKLKTLTFVTGLAIATGLLSGLALFGVNRTNAASCTANDIMKCGFSTPSDFIAKVRANDNGVNSTQDLQAIYAHYGLTASEYDDFAAHAVQGEAMRDGRIVVNGKTVGSGGMSIGRDKSLQGSGPFTVTIGGHDYFGNVNSQAFAAGVNEIPVYVLLGSDGSFKFAVMPACGNPEFPSATPPPAAKDTAACQVLNKTADPSQANTFDFTAAAVKTGSATVTKFVYDFGDGSPTVTETDGTVSVPHTYAKSGTFTASVTVFATVNGSTQQLPTIVMCTKQVVVAPAPVTPTPPPAPTPPTITPLACKQLFATPSIDNKLMITFLAQAVTNGNTLTSADFDFGDGNKLAGVTPDSDGMSVTTTHTYGGAGTFLASAVLHFNDTNGQPATSTVCNVTVFPTAPVAAPPTTPPVVTAVQPQPAQPLPNTGAGDVIGLFTIMTAAGYLSYRVFLHRKLSRG